ncbi:hypothetical protein HU200_066468 [Digitaria exilis]|uniref:Uncharacterized protein n=1 Tax=Digitaria exilis TaxID=1010633 RepID=A0A835DWL7_9POAL|nr:hypothetical protein HU200_066468 [Digitaria exilis]
MASGPAAPPRSCRHGGSDLMDRASPASLRTTDPDDFCLRLIEVRGATSAPKPTALILNTFDTLEADVLAALRAEYPRIYTIGALTSLLAMTPAESGHHRAELGSRTRVPDVAGHSGGRAPSCTPTSAATRCLAGEAGRVRVGPSPLAAPVPLVHQGRPRPRRGGLGRAATGVRGRDGGAVLPNLVVPTEQVLCDAQRVELDVREPRRRRADGVLAGVAERVSEVMGSGNAEEREKWRRKRRRPSVAQVDPRLRMLSKRFEHYRIIRFFDLNFFVCKCSISMFLI